LPLRLLWNAIRRPSGDQAGLPSNPRARQPTLAAPVGIHHVDLEVAGAVALEGDAAAVRRPARFATEPSRPQQPALPAAI